MFSVRPDALSPWLHVEPPPANDPPGFRVAPDGAMHDSQSDLAFTPFRNDPRVNAAALGTTDFEDAIRRAADGLYPETYLTYDPVGFAALSRDSIREALDQITRIYGGFGANPPGSLGQRRPGTTPVNGRPFSPNVSGYSPSQAPEPSALTNAARQVESDAPTATRLSVPIGDLGQLLPPKATESCESPSTRELPDRGCASNRRHHPLTRQRRSSPAGLPRCHDWDLIRLPMQALFPSSMPKKKRQAMKYRSHNKTTSRQRLLARRSPVQRLHLTTI